MKQYESYKDSHIPSIGNVPDGWKVVPIKYVLEQSSNGIKIGPFGSTLTGKVSPDNEVKVYGQWNVIGKDFSAGKNYVSEKTYQELESYWIHPNDILISMMGTVGKCAIIPKVVAKGIMDSHIVKVRLDVSVILPQYFYYVYDKDGSNVVMSQIQRDRRGSIMDGLNSTLIKDFIIPLPSIPEQKAIASYLDTKVGQIDTIIAEKEAMVDDLQNYRKSIISEAVTRGLNPEVPMKDSGIEKFPKTPSHWKVVKLKHIARINSGNAIPGTSLTENGAYEVYGGNGCMGFTAQYNTDAPAIVIGRVGALCGNIHLIYTPKWVTDNALILRLLSDDTYEFVAYYLDAYDLNTLNSSNAQPLITGTKVLDVYIPVPSLQEQKTITEYLKDKTSTIDNSIQELQLQIKDLKLYKASIITEAVTGKIDLR